MSKSAYLEHHILDALYGGGSFTAPATVWLAIYTSDPTDDDTGDEVSGGGYARVALATGTDLTVTGSAMTNAADIETPESTAAWGTVTHWGLRDAAVGGNLLHHGAITPSRTVDSAGIAIRILTGDLDVTED